MNAASTNSAPALISTAALPPQTSAAQRYRVGSGSHRSSQKKNQINSGNDTAAASVETSNGTGSPTTSSSTPTSSRASPRPTMAMIVSLERCRRGCSTAMTFGSLDHGTTVPDKARLLHRIHDRATAAG